MAVVITNKKREKKWSIVVLSVWLTQSTFISIESVLALSDFIDWFDSRLQKMALGLSRFPQFLNNDFFFTRERETNLRQHHIHDITTDGS